MTGNSKMQIHADLKLALGTTGVNDHEKFRIILPAFPPGEQAPGARRRVQEILLELELLSLEYEGFHIGVRRNIVQHRLDAYRKPPAF